MLNRLGYKVIATSRASEAEAALTQGTSFDLLLSDAVLPDGSSGPMFAREALAQYPEMKCIFMSGNTPQSTASTTIDKELQLLQNPFTMEQLNNALVNELN
jgi:DNA-binding NtrC family response regulator